MDPALLPELLAEWVERLLGLEQHRVVLGSANEQEEIAVYQRAVSELHALRKQLERALETPEAAELAAADSGFPTARLAVWGSQPEQWSELLRTADIHFGRRPQWHGRLSERIAASIWSGATEELRERFLQGDPNSVGLSAMLGALPLLGEVSDAELRALMACAFGGEHGVFYHSALEAAKRWLQAQPEQVQRILEGELQAKRDEARLNAQAISFMAEAVLQGGAVEASWRDALLQAFHKGAHPHRDEASVHIAFFGWPTDLLDVELPARYGTLYGLLTLRPEQRLRFAFNALAKEALRAPDPEQALVAALSWIKTFAGEPGTGSVEELKGLAFVGRNVLHALQKVEDTVRRALFVDGVAELLRWLVPLPPSSASALDMLLKLLAQHNTTVVERFLGAWIVEHFEALQETRLDRALPDLMEYEAEPRSCVGWLVRLMLDRDREVRRVATHELHRLHQGFSSADMELLEDHEQARLWLLQAFGDGLIAPTWLPVAIEAGLRWPELRGWLRDHLIKCVAPVWPSTLEDRLERWTQYGDAELRRDAEAVLVARRAVYEARHAARFVVEVQTTRPAREVFRAVRDELFREAARAEKARGFYVHMSLPTLPIARGRSFTLRSSDETPGQTQEHSSSPMESPTPADPLRELSLREAALKAVRTELLKGTPDA